MEHTKVDDMLIEMITPKVKEIEEKFVNNEPLTQNDINTLLLKSQYNHINHLDIRMNEITVDVANLRSDINADIAGLKHDFKMLEQKVEQRFETFEQRFETFENKMESTIQKALNKNMLQLVTIMGIFVLASKIVDLFK